MKNSKQRVRALYSKYNMEIARNPITSEGWSVYLDTDKQIPELEELQNENSLHVQMEVIHFAPGFIRYRIICPVDWFDLSGLKETEN